MQQENGVLQAGFQSLVKRARVLGTEVSSKVKERAQDFLDEGRVQDSEWNRDRDGRANDRDYRASDQTDGNNEFDFDDWDEQDQTRPQASEPPTAQRYNKRSIDTDDDRNASDALSNQNEPDRPLLNLSIPQPSKPDDASRSFTAKPRPEIPDLRKNDPWDDDDWG